MFTTSRPTHGSGRDSGRVKGYTHDKKAWFVRMIRPQNAIQCSEFAHQIESRKIEPDFVVYSTKKVITVGQKLMRIFTGSALILLGIIFGFMFEGGWVATLPISILGLFIVLPVVVLKPPFSEDVNLSVSQVYISSINTLVDYNSQNNEIVRCQTMTLNQDSYITYSINKDRDIHTYTLVSGAKKVTLLGNAYGINQNILDFAKKYGVDIKQ